MSSLDNIPVHWASKHMGTDIPNVMYINHILKQVKQISKK